MVRTPVKTLPARSKAEEVALIDLVQTSFCRVDRAKYPELAAYNRDDIYGHGDNMAPGALFLATQMARALDAAPDQLVLDLGCGKGDSSIFLANAFGARVVAADLWIPRTFLEEKFESRGCGDGTTAVHLDVRRGLPFETGRFDAIFCMQALHSFGATVDFIHRVLRCLKPGGRMVVASSCFNEERPFEALPAVYHRTDGWDAEYRNYHSPGWWRELFEAIGDVDVLECAELEDGAVYWEDDFLYRGESRGWDVANFEDALWLIEHILHGRSHRPYLTHYMATLRKWG